MFVTRSKVKAYLLDRAKATRHHAFERVSAEVYTHLEGMVVKEMDRIIASHPSKGKTIKP
jgi:hypothetical protein